MAMRGHHTTSPAQCARSDSGSNVGIDDDLGPRFVIGEATGLFLRSGYSDALRTIEPLLRAVKSGPGATGLDQIRRSSHADLHAAYTTRSPGASPHRTFGASPKPSDQPSSPSVLTDNDVAAVLLIAGYSQLLLQADLRWVRSIAMALTDRYPLFTLGFILRAEADAATGDFENAFALLAHAEQDIHELEDRPLFSCVHHAASSPRKDQSAASSSGACVRRGASGSTDQQDEGSLGTSNTQLPARASTTGGRGESADPLSLSGAERIPADQVDSTDEDEDDAAPVGFMHSSSRTYIRAVWLHVSSKRFGDTSFGATSEDRLQSLSASRLSHSSPADVSVVHRYISCLRSHLHKQHAAWLHFRAVALHARCVMAVVYPCPKCGAVSVAGEVVPPPQWRCLACAASRPSRSGSSLARSGSFSRASSHSDMRFSRSGSTTPSAAAAHPKKLSTAVALGDATVGRSPQAVAPARSTGGDAPRRLSPEVEGNILHISSSTQQESPVPSPSHGVAAQHRGFTAVATMPTQRRGGGAGGGGVISPDQTNAAGRPTVTTAAAATAPKSPAPGSFAHFRQVYADDATGAAPAHPHLLSSPPSNRASDNLTGTGAYLPSFGSFMSAAASCYRDVLPDEAKANEHDANVATVAPDKSAGLLWAPDASSCQRCRKSIGPLTRHHCRSCGRLVCGPCSARKRAVPLLGFDEPVRVCTNCADVIDSGTVAPAPGVLAGVRRSQSSLA
jgi:hypothetical protein